MKGFPHLFLVVETLMVILKLVHTLPSASIVVSSGI
jgi:hypothetical protein